MTVLPPLALYVHFPWCVRKCPYCDFNSHRLKGELPEHAYVEALLADVRQQATACAGREIVSIFLGGGTPSLFPPRAIARLLEGVRAALAVADDLEVTLEANPGTIERGRFAEYRAAGIDRVSLGAQSFAARQLAALGRIHSADETRRAAAELHAAGLSNFNLDLMFALPGQATAEALVDIEAALELEPAHVSHYQLTLEPGTAFAAAPPALPDEDLAWEMQEACQQRLAAAGFEQYEVSAYATAGRRCRHNLNYWRFGDYLGVGAGAHGKLTSPGEPLRIQRTTRPRDPRRYVAEAASAPAGLPVAASERPFEFMLNALRLVEGFPPSIFEERTGMPLRNIAPIVERQRVRNLMETAENGDWRATSLGLRFLNDVVAAFLIHNRQSRVSKLTNYVAIQ